MPARWCAACAFVSGFAYSECPSSRNDRATRRTVARQNSPEIVWKKDRIRVNQKEVEKAERSRECPSEGPSEGQCCHQWSVTFVLQPIHHSLKENRLQSSVHHSSHLHQTLPNTATSVPQTHTTCHCAPGTNWGTNLFSQKQCGPSLVEAEPYIFKRIPT